MDDTNVPLHILKDGSFPARGSAFFVGFGFEAANQRVNREALPVEGQPCFIASYGVAKANR